MKTLLTQKVDPDLLHAWANNDVELEHQYALAMVKITTLGRFASIEDNKEAFKKLMAGTCRIDESTIPGKVAMADLLTAWQTAQTMAKAEIDKKAMTSVGTGTKVPMVPKRTYAAMASAFKTDHGKKDEGELPGETLVGLLVSMIEDNDPIAVPLTDVVSVEDGFEVVSYNDQGPDGITRAHQKKVKKVALPMDAESLRMRYTVLDNGFSYARYKHNNIAWPGDSTGAEPGVHACLAKYFLGKKCLKLE